MTTVSRSPIELARVFASTRTPADPRHVETIARALLAAEADFDAILRECERANDVRVSHMRISGNIHLIVQRALSVLRGSE